MTKTKFPPFALDLNLNQHLQLKEAPLLWSRYPSQYTMETCFGLAAHTSNFGVESIIGDLTSKVRS